MAISKKGAKAPFLFLTLNLKPNLNLTLIKNQKPMRKPFALLRCKDKTRIS